MGHVTQYTILWLVLHHAYWYRLVLRMINLHISEWFVTCEPGLATDSLQIWSFEVLRVMIDVASNVTL